MTKEDEELAEARKYIQDLHDRGKYSNLDVLLVNYAKHSKLKMLKELIEKDGWCQECGLQAAHKLIKQIEGSFAE